MRHVEGLPAVAFDVGGVDTHARFVFSVLAGGDAGAEGDVVKRPVVVVDEEEVRPGVIGDCDVRPAVVIEVGQHHPHALRLRDADARFFAYVRERPVVVVVEQLDPLTLVVVGMAVGAIARPVFPAPDIVFR